MRQAIGLLVVATVGLALAVAVGAEQGPGQGPGLRTPDRPGSTVDIPSGVHEVEGIAGGLRIDSDRARAIGLKTEPVRIAQRKRVVTLPGRLEIDPDHLVNIHPRFSGEIVEVGTIPGDDGKPRQLRVGDSVKPGQLLAVLWSLDLAIAKTTYLDALSEAMLERETFQKTEALHKKDLIAERDYRTARREFEAAEIAASRAERNLYYMRVPIEDIHRVEAAAQTMHTEHRRPAFDPKTAWARYVINAPIEGVILQKNLILGNVVGPEVDLAQVADLTPVGVRARAREFDMHDMRQLTPPLRWAIRLEGHPNEPPIPGTISYLSQILDPEDHTGTLYGLLPNTQGNLHPGHRVTATLEVDPGGDEVEVAARAPVEDGPQTVVFVQPKPDEPVFVRRRVVLVHRSGPYANLLIASESPAETDAESRFGLTPGEVVVTAGASDLKAFLRLLEGTRPE